MTKDFAGSLPGAPVAPDEREPCELVALEPDGLTVLDRLVLPEPSIARLSSDGDHVYVVGDTSLLRVGWDGRFVPDPGFRAAYRTGRARPTAGTACWRSAPPGSSTTATAPTTFDGSFRGQGGLDDPAPADPGGPVGRLGVDGRRLRGRGWPHHQSADRGRGASIAVGYDSGNGVMAAFDIAGDGA